MPIIEKLGSFFLGREVDPKTDQVAADRPVNYDSRDLTTHAVCVGMTGSGKTGLCIALLEEAALDNVPAIIIDPKGDITNLLLTFPELRGEDFLPWINAEDARGKGQTPEAYAREVAQAWAGGLASWEEGPERIRALKSAVDFAIYTPGSDAGLPVSILSSFRAPDLDWETEAETLRDRIQGTVSGLLALAGIAADPIRSREHILLSTIIENAWRAGQDLDIARLITAVQKPPFRQIGVFEVDTFFPPKERFGLAIALNNIIAAPSFAAWTQGAALDIDKMLYTADGKPRHSIFYIAHLSDAERMFFVTLLLEQVISWMRGQPGTTSLRAIVYMDELFGYFPPTANPPSKRPLLALLKQARAFGVGMLLTTQNPADIDYKGLSNAGTWFIGKLQTERDKARLMSGLESAMAEAGASIAPAALDKIISSLDNRVFLLHDVHRDAPQVFTTRWAMSYLAGPLTRQQIKTLMADRKAEAKAADDKPHEFQAGAAGAAAEPSQAQPKTPLGMAAFAPILPPKIKQAYLPVTVTGEEGAQALVDTVNEDVTVTGKRLIYEPALVGFASVRFTDRKLGFDQRRDYALLLPLEGGSQIVYWKYAQAARLTPRDLADKPEDGVLFVRDLPTAVTDAHEFSGLAGDLADALYRSQAIHLLWNPALKLASRPGESERDFRIRCLQAAREQRDAAVDRLRDKYSDQIQRLRDLSQIDRLKRDLEQDAGDATSRWSQAAGELQQVVVAPSRADIDVQSVALAWAPMWEVTYQDAHGQAQTATVQGYSNERL